MDPFVKVELERRATLRKNIGGDTLRQAIALEGIWDELTQIRAFLESEAKPKGSR